MAINIANGFNITSSEAVDARIIKSKEEMLNMTTPQLNRMPDKYLCICSDDGQLYLFDKESEPNTETGKFKMITSDCATKEEVNNKSKVTASQSGSSTNTINYLTIDETEYKLPSGSSSTSNYNDLSNRPQINGATLTGNKTASDLGLAVSNHTHGVGDITGLSTTYATKTEVTTLREEISDISDTLNTKISDAPANNYLYGRKNGIWEVVEGGSQYTAGNGINIESNVISADTVEISESMAGSGIGTSIDGKLNLIINQNEFYMSPTDRSLNLNPTLIETINNKVDYSTYTTGLAFKEDKAKLTLNLKDDMGGETYILDITENKSDTGTEGHITFIVE